MSCNVLLCLAVNGTPRHTEPWQFFFSAAKKKFKRRVQMTKATLENRTNSQKIRVKTASTVTSTRQHFYWFCLLKARFYLVLNNNYFEWIIKQLYSFIHSFIRPYVSSFVRRSFHLSKPVSPFVSSFRRSFFRPFIPSFVRPSVCLFARPSVHSFIYPLVCSFSLFMCSEDVTYIKQNHRRSPEHGAPFSWKTIQI